MYLIEKIELPNGITIRIYPDEDAPNPVTDWMECVELWGIGRRCNVRTQKSAYDKDAFFLALAQSIYPGFPYYLERSEHAEAIARKYYAISSDVGGQSDTVYMVALKSDYAKCYGTKPEDIQTCVENDAEIYRKWAEGECVGYVTEIEGEETDSCWGFYSAKEAIEAAKENLPTRNEQYFFDRAEN